MNRIEEYSSLREEILQNRTNIKDYRLLAFTATTATLVFSCSDIAKNEPFISLLPIMIIIPLHLLCTKCYQSMAKIGAYICVFLYDDGFIWEKMTNAFEAEYTLTQKTDTKIRFLKRESSFIMLIIICGIVALYRCLKMCYSSNELIIRLIILIAVTILAEKSIFDNHTFLEKSRTDYVEKWEKLRKKMNTQKLENSKD